MIINDKTRGEKENDLKWVWAKNDVTAGDIAHIAAVDRHRMRAVGRLGWADGWLLLHERGTLITKLAVRISIASQSSHSIEWY